MRRIFGQLPCGTDIHAITLRSREGLEAELLTYGGILRTLNLSVAGRTLPLVLGLPDLPAYLADHDSLGILVGRFGNRIANSRFVLDGIAHVLAANEGRNHLHGGASGFGRRVWTVAELAEDRAVLTYASPAGEEGYPGSVEVSARFRLRGHDLELEFAARSDAATPINLTHHPYFNLAGDASIPAAAQRLRIPADRYLPIDAELIPTGEVASVDVTPFDFRQSSSLREQIDPAYPQIALGHGYDHCLVLVDAADCSAELYSPHSGVAMRITSDAPAVQLYGGQGLAKGRPQLGDGLCLEPQGYPDAPNQPHFPDCILRPGQDYRRHIVYRFAVAGTAAAWEQVQVALDRTAPLS